MTFAFVGRSALRAVIGWILGAVLLPFAAEPAWCAVTTDVIVSTNRSTSASNITSPSFSTTSAAELLLAFVATDAKSPGITVTSMSGAGLTWVLVRRTNVQLGTAEIWRAFAPAKLSGVTVRANLPQSVAASITVVTFIGTDTSGTNGAGAIGATGSGNANPGAPSASLVTTRDNSWVFGVGNDYDNATVRTVPSNQIMVNQYLATVGDTYWLQRQKFPTALSGTTVTINDTGPTADRYNLTIVEVRAAPPSGATYTVSGAITPPASGSGATLTLSGASAATVTADGNGNYTFTGLANGSYTVTPTKAGFSFTPVNRAVTVNGANLTAINFTAAAVTYSITGTINPAANGSGATLTLSGASAATVTAGGNGNYTFTGLANGSYTVTPTKAGFTFTPVNKAVIVNGANVTAINFSATPTSQPLNYPDLSDIIPTGQISVAGSGSTRVFRYTHDTFNGGSGPLVIQPVYNAASGNYNGIQYIYSFSGGTWTLARQIPIAGIFIFDSDHGHFHFPFTTYGLYTLAGDGGIGTPVAVSPKISFCINDSFIYDPSLPNAGALGNLGSCSDPTSLRGLDIGAVDEYDQTDPGQSISLAGVPDGTYWLRAIVDPDNFLFESDKSNNETDVKLTISGNTVTVLQTVTPVLPPPPSITLTSPADQTQASGTVNLTASTAIGTAVQFLLDGQALGSPVAASPYTLAWDTAAVPNGEHWIAAQTTDATSGRTGTSGVARVTVVNGGSNPPVVTVTSPPAGATVSAVVSVGATVADAAPIVGVQLYVDGVPVGAPLTAAPYLVFWNTLTVADGPHALTVSATDSFNLTGTSAPVTVTVDNSHPPNTIGTDAMVYSDASGTMTTPAFSTTTNSDLLVAFVAYDGPSNAPQTASVSGAGLPWTLLKRSNFQHGTSEIWATKASDFLTNVTVTSQPGVSGYHGSLVVVAFTNAAGPGIVGEASAPSGAPDIYLPGVSAGDWVFAVGNDWDSAVGRVPVSGQVLVHQRIDSGTGDTYWVQSTATPSTANGLVDIHDNSPTTDQWNCAAVEIVATRQ